MAAMCALLLWALVLSCNVSCGLVSADKHDEDYSDWLDPIDMLNYDLVTGTMRNTEVCHCFFLFHGKLL